jgi:hypothetical protein
LRARVAHDRELIGAVGRLFVDTVLGFYARKSRLGHPLLATAPALALVLVCRAQSPPLSPPRRRHRCLLRAAAAAHGAKTSDRDWPWRMNA